MRGRAAALRRRTAGPGAAPFAAANAGKDSTARRRTIGVGLAGALALGLQACGLTPTRRSDTGDDYEGGGDDLDLAAGGAGSEVVMQALANVGKPYRWGGDNPEEGFDCSGLVVHVYEDALGIRLPRTSRQMSRRGVPIDRKQLFAGDLVFFNTSRRAYSHVGIYIGRGRFVHAPSTGSLVRVERLSNRYWAARYDGARRLVKSVAANN